MCESGSWGQNYWPDYSVCWNGPAASFLIISLWLRSLGQSIEFLAMQYMYPCPDYISSTSWKLYWIRCVDWKAWNDMLIGMGELDGSIQMSFYLLMMRISSDLDRMSNGHGLTLATFVNSLRPIAYMHHQPRPSLVQIMAWCMSSTKPLSEPVLYYWQLDP